MAGQHNRDKYPEIWAEFQRKVARKEALMAKRRPFLDQMDDKFRQIEAIRAEIEVISAKAYEDIDELREVSREISRFARAMGADSLAATEN